MSAEISPLRDAGSPRELLHRVLQDVDRLKGLMVVCFWDTGSTTTGWSGGTNAHYAYGTLKLQTDITARCIEPPPQDE